MGLGRFNEATTGIEDSRFSIAITKKDDREIDAADRWGLGLTGEGFWYGQAGVNREEVTFRSWWRHQWTPGYLMLTSDNIRRNGETPFYFDSDPEISWYANVELDWRGKAHSNFRFKYDALESEWQEAHGILEWQGKSAFGVRFLGDYLFTQTYAINQSVYVVEVKYNPSWQISNRLLYNADFELIGTGVHYQTKVAAGEMTIDLTYDLLEEALASAQWVFTEPSLGKWILVYDFNRPQIALVYQW